MIHQRAPSMAAERTGTRIYRELLNAAEIFTAEKPKKKGLLMIMRLLGLDIGQWSTRPTDAMQSVSDSNTLFTTD